MLCECCQEREATIHVTQVVNGEGRELHLCEECAEEHGLNVQGAMSVPELLFGTGPTRGEAAAPAKACPQCHLRKTDYKKRGRLGCPACYDTFAEELAPVLAAMHKGTAHTGKIPRRFRESGPAGTPRATRREDLLRQMEAALKAENYEEAARLRDRLQGTDG